MPERPAVNCCRSASFVRLEVDVNMPKNLAEVLAYELDLKYNLDVYHVPNLIHSVDLLKLPIQRDDLVPALMFPPLSPITHPRLVAPFEQKDFRRNIQWHGSKWKGIRSIFSEIR